jgi:hypothetical protein
MKIAGDSGTPDVAQISKSSVNNRLQFLVRVNGVIDQVNVNGLSDVDWMPLALTFSDSTQDGELKAYKDAVQVGTTKAFNDPWTEALDVTDGVLIGTNTSGPANVWNGLLAHYAVWRVVLTDAQIATIHNASDPMAQILATQPDDLIGYWPLDDAPESGEARDVSRYATQDITADVLSADWELGFGQPYAHIARPARATLVLNNSAGQYAPENASALSGFDAGKALRIRSTFQAATRQHAVLWIRRVEPDGNQYGERRAKITCEGFLARAQRHQADVPIQLNKTADQIVEALLEATLLYPPGFAGYWLVGAPGYTELGHTTRLGDTATYSDFDTGISVFPYAMDNNRSGSSLYAALRLVAESEQGRVGTDRDGKVFFWSRHHLALDTTSDEMFDDMMFDLDYRYGESLVNRITVRHNPRKLDATGTPTLGTLDRALWIRAGESREVMVRFADGSGARISSTSVITPVANTDYTANSAEDGSGSDLTGLVAVTLEAMAQSARLNFTNNANVDAYVQPGATVRGNDKLTDFGQMEVSHQDDASAAAYGLRSEVVNARLLEDPVVAENLARWLVVSRGDARGEARRVTFKPRRSDGLMTAALSRVIGDRVTAQETHTGLSADFFIVGERHRLRGGGMDHTVIWTLEPASAQLFWILDKVGYSEIGQTTILGY